MVCESSEFFPGYASSVVPLDVPPWLSDLATEEDEDEAAQ
jgi:hypothetical protein